MLRSTSTHSAERREPYIYHFPDGNASLARLLVRALVPHVAPGHTMDDIVLAPFDYDALDRRGQDTRIRLDSTCVDGKLHQVGKGIFGGPEHDNIVKPRSTIRACLLYSAPIGSNVTAGADSEARHAHPCSIRSSIR